jgi:hypothetical protein
MPAKLDRCVDKLKKKGWSEDKAYAICNASINDSDKKFSFSDAIQYDAKTKKCISVRDGVQEYLGIELGLKPEHKTFTVYRSPKTIQDAASLMEGIPVTVGHVPLSEEPQSPSGSIKSSSVVGFTDEATSTTLAIENNLALNDEAINKGHNEFSLGYFADIIPHDEFDFEQVDVVPHHLAIVERGRCGSACSFSDSQIQNKGNTMKKLFFDEDGQLNMQQIVEAVAALPEVIKSVPLDKLQEIMPAVNELVAAANAAGVEVEMPEEEMPESEVTDMGEEEMKDQDPQEEKKPMEDSAEFKDALKKGIASAVTLHGEVIEKAKLFVDEDYSFTGKKTCEIMRDALATQHGKQEFGDEELSIAFKMLKKTADYSNFSDEKAGSLQQLKDKEL